MYTGDFYLLSVAEQPYLHNKRSQEEEKRDREMAREEERERKSERQRDREEKRVGIRKKKKRIPIDSFRRLEVPVTFFAYHYYSSESINKCFASR